MTLSNNLTFVLVVGIFAFLVLIGILRIPTTVDAEVFFDACRESCGAAGVEGVRVTRQAFGLDRAIVQECSCRGEDDPLLVEPPADAPAPLVRPG